MTTASWLQLIGTVVVVAVGYGTLQAKVASLRELVAELKAGRQRTGERLERMHTDIELLKYAVRRSPTGVVTVRSEPPEEEKDT